jgi:hypothetical protein
MLRLLVTADVVPSSPILVTLTMEAIRSSETVLTKPNSVTSQKMAFLKSHQLLSLLFCSYIKLSYFFCHFQFYIKLLGDESSS